MTIEIDRAIYSDACVTKCIYALSKDFDCRRSLNSATESVEIVPRDSKVPEDEVCHIFMQTLNDYKAREIIAAETKDIRTILYAKAFGDCDDFEEDVRQ
jgi:His-Xaa-Ser system protein HxsD